MGLSMVENNNQKLSSQGAPQNMLSPWRIRRDVNGGHALQDAFNLILIGNYKERVIGGMQMVRTACITELQSDARS